MSELIRTPGKPDVQIKGYDFGAGCDTVRIGFSTYAFFRPCRKAEIYCDGEPIGICMLSNRGNADFATAEITPTSGVHDVEVRVDGDAIIHSVEFDNSREFEKCDYVPTPDKKIDDVNSEYWEAVDMLGRKVSSAEDVRGKRDKKVGMFYWTWRNGHLYGPPQNVTQTLLEHPEAEYNMQHSAWGDGPRVYHWNEPYFGYYRNDDPYVIRKHAIMFANAGVDFLVFDCTNGTMIWKDAYEPLFEGFHEAKELGIKVPKLAFMLNFGPVYGPLENVELTLRTLYQDLYRPGKFSDLWFMLDGKPFIMAYPEAIPEKGVCEEDTKFLNEMREFFTFRPGQPGYGSGPSRPDHWGWLEKYPQHKYGEREDGTCEMVTVGVAQNANDEHICTYFNNKNTYGRSYTHEYGHALLDDESYKYGYNVQEQWERALDLDPDMIFITGWNEWCMGKYKEPWVLEPESNQVAFVDQFNREYSRDIEPDIDGYLDTYYLQMISNIRRFKGAGKRTPASEPVTININGSLRQWKKVAPEYRNNYGSAINRDFDGFPTCHYTNNSARNNIVKAKVARDEKNLYFMAETAEKLTAPEGEGWMTLYIDSDRSKDSGWEGYDFVINRQTPKNGRATVERYVRTVEEGSYTWEKIGYAKIRIKDNAVVLEIDREMLGMADGLNFEFKWSDNMQKPEIMDFYANGDSAPFGRFNYLFKE